MVLSRQTLETGASHRRGSFRNAARHILPGILLASFLFAGCGSATIENRRTDITIELESNPTTGYTWDWIQEGTGSLSLVNESFVEPSASILGAAGKQVFVFSGGTPGEVSLTFTYARPWEPSSLAPVDTRVFHFTVGSRGNITESR
ncbi:MAG: protease inhibitor I42 family protein [Sphaerochaetaceae bacterium]|nr:protease inhibitor I42 family protein [Sphaerochaetaceae bacterium]